MCGKMKCALYVDHQPGLHNVNKLMFLSGEAEGSRNMADKSMQG